MLRIVCFGVGHGGIHSLQHFCGERTFPLVHMWFYHGFAHLRPHLSAKLKDLYTFLLGAKK